MARSKEVHSLIRLDRSRSFFCNPDVARRYDLHVELSCAVVESGLLEHKMYYVLRRTLVIMAMYYIEGPRLGPH